MGRGGGIHDSAAVMSEVGSDVERLLILLQDAGSEFIVTGGVAAIAHGASTITQDRDVAAPMTPASLGRLLDALRPLHPRHAIQPDLGEIEEPPERLAGYRLLMLTTDPGRLDVVRDLRPIGCFEDLETAEMELVENRRLGVLSLDQLIEVKATLPRPQDHEVGAELRVIRELLRGAD